MVSGCGLLGIIGGLERVEEGGERVAVWLLSLWGCGWRCGLATKDFQSLPLARQREPLPWGCPWH